MARITGSSLNRGLFMIIHRWATSEEIRNTVVGNLDTCEQSEMGLGERIGKYY